MLINVGTNDPTEAAELSALALSVVPEPTAPASLRNLFFEGQILRPHPRTTESACGAQQSVLTRLLSDSDSQKSQEMFRGLKVHSGDRLCSNDSPPSPMTFHQ